MITVANLASIQQAQNMRMLLGSAGIEAFIPDDYSATITPHFFMGQAGGVRLQVSDQDEEEALQIIEHGFDEIEPIGDVDDVAED
ncbi:MAG: DUF2007 domain-containing protein [Verrucomicrobiales bacterium]|nr:DUF2007 domain-containing protein [Verrucomicrobiales bacterium]